VSDTPGDQHWWQAIDGKWYPPESHPNYVPPPPPPASSPLPAPSVAPGSSPVIQPPAKPLWRCWWALALGALVLIVVIAAAAGGGDDDDDAAAPTPAEPTATDAESAEEVPDEPSVATSGEEPRTTEVAAPTSDPVDTSPPSTAPSGVGLSLDSPADVGVPVVVGEWTVRVAAITPDAAALVAAENQFNDPPAAGKQFFMATLEATYIGSESSTFWIDNSLKAVGASNVAYEGFDSSCGVLPDDVDRAGEAFPGGTISGNVCWSIDAADAGTMTMLVEPSFSFDDDVRRFFSMDPTAVIVDGSTSADAPTPQPIEGVSMGESVAVGDWTIRVAAITPDAGAVVAAENQFNDPPAPGKQFFMVTVEATYDGTESSTFWFDMSLESVGASAVAYDGFQDSCGVLPDALSDVGETFPGGRVTGNVCWSVDAADAATLTMLASPSFSFDDERAAFSLTN
jgi:hypothetical protein